MVCQLLICCLVDIGRDEAWSQFCFVLCSLQLFVCLWWHDYRRDDFPTLKFGVVLANLAHHLLREEPLVQKHPHLERQYLGIATLVATGCFSLGAQAMCLT